MTEKTEKLGNWSNHEYFNNYVWSTQIDNKIRKQQASVEPTPTCQNRGNFRVAYDVISFIDSVKYLNNYYFVQLVAQQEVENWAQIINNTIDLKLCNIMIDSNKVVELCKKDYFYCLLSPAKLIFENNYQVDVWRFDSHLTDKRFQLEMNDLFPRYYTVEAFARIEMNNWIDVWMRQYLMQDKIGNY